MDNINIDHYLSMNEISKESWENGWELPFPLRYNSLISIEKSAINQIKQFYLKIRDKNEDIGRANLFLSDTDFSTMDNSLAKVRGAIKQLYPRFLTFKTLECGFFTMLGEGIFTKSGRKMAEVFPGIAESMDAISKDNDVDIQIIRDVPFTRYDEYKEALLSIGFYQCLGFPRPVIKILWTSIENYLSDLKHETRKYYKQAFKLKEKFQIGFEVVRDFKQHIPRLHKLWENVHKRAKEYSREVLTREYFEATADYLSDQSEVLIYKQDNQIVAFNLCLFDESTYYTLYWGVDYDFKDYKSAQLYRANDLFCLKRAIELGKKYLDMGITNYDPKLEIGAEAEPLIYFVKHVKEKLLSKTLARQIMDSIKQPNNFVHRPFKEISHNTIDLGKWSKKITSDQNWSIQNDVFTKVYQYQKINKIRLSGLYSMYPEFSTAQKSSILFGGKKIILLGTNSYLGAATGSGCYKGRERSNRSIWHRMFRISCTEWDIGYS